MEPLATKVTIRLRPGRKPMVFVQSALPFGNIIEHAAEVDSNTSIESIVNTGVQAARAFDPAAAKKAHDEATRQALSQAGE